MKRSPYSAYHGRSSWLRRILVAIVILLVIALAAAIVGLFVLPNYIVYTPEGPQLVLPLFTREPAAPTPGATLEPSGAPAPSALPSPADDIVIETPTAGPSPSAAPALDLKDLPARRTAPLGLIPYEEGKTVGSKQGFLFTAEQVEDFTLSTSQEDYGYVAVYLDAGGLDSDALAEACLTLVQKGIDELVLAGDVDWPALRKTLPSGLFHGYLSAVAEKAPFQNDTQQGRDMARHCDRVYVPGGNWNGLNLYRYLKDNGFVGTTADIVTTVSAPLNTNYAWAVLP